MDKTIRVDGNRKMLRLDNRNNELFVLESALLKGEKLKADVRRRIALETKNLEILHLCIHDSAITVVTAAKENPILTPEMKLEISKIEKAWEQSKQYKLQEETMQIEHVEDNQHRDKKTNWWSIISFILFITVCTLSYALYESYNKIHYLRWQQNYLQDTKNQEISSLQEQLQSKDATINSLQEQLPKTYYTKYPNQAIYYWDGDFIKAGSYYRESGICLNVYLQKDGYGMTEFGWIPMNCLSR